MSEVSAVIYGALRKAGVTLGPGRTPSPAQTQDGIAELNRLLGSLSRDRYWIYSLDVLTFPLEPGKATYTIGPAGDFDTPRPQRITFANVYSTGDVRYPLDIYTPQQWASESQPVSPGAIPEALYNDGAYPLSTLSVYPQPAETMQLEMYTWHLIPAVSTETDTIDWPEGYEDAVVLNLACRLAPQFQLPVHPDLRQQARESMMRIESLNAPQPILDTGGGLGCGCGWNVYTDE